MCFSSGPVSYHFGGPNVPAPTGRSHRKDAVRQIIWYFDFISPYAYFGLHELERLGAGVRIEYRPVLFAGLLNHWGQRGPAEIPPKRTWTYRWCTWHAAQRGIPSHKRAINSAAHDQDVERSIGQSGQIALHLVAKAIRCQPNGRTSESGKRLNRLTNTSLYNAAFQP